MCDEEKKCACWVPDCPQELTCEDFDSGCKEAFDGLGLELDIGIQTFQFIFFIRKFFKIKRLVTYLYLVSEKLDF